MQHYFETDFVVVTALRFF